MVLNYDTNEVLKLRKCSIQTSGVRGLLSCL